MPRREIFISIILPVTPEFRTDYICDLYNFLQVHFLNFEVLAICDVSNLPPSAKINEWLTQFKSFRFIQVASGASIETLIIAGCENIIGDILVAMNPNSDPIEMIPKLIAEVENTNCLLLGQPQNYALSPIESFNRRLFYKFCQVALGLEIKENTSQFIAMNRSTVNSVNRINPKFRFYRALTGVAYGKVMTFKYLATHPENRLRRSFWSSLHFALCVITTNTLRPIYYSLGLCALSIGLLLFNLFYSVLGFSYFEIFQFSDLIFNFSLFLFALTFFIFLIYLSYRIFEASPENSFFVISSQDSIRGIKELQNQINVVSQTHKEDLLHEKK